MNGSMLSEIELILQEAKEKIVEMDSLFSVDSLRLELDDALEEKAKLKRDEIENRVKLIINPTVYSTLNSSNKRKVLIYHEVVHFWVGEDVDSDNLQHGSYRDRLWKFTERLNEETKRIISNSTRKRYDCGFEEILVHETTAKLLGMDFATYYQSSDYGWNLDQFHGTSSQIDRVLDSISNLFPDIKRVIDALTRINLEELNEIE